MNRFLYKRKSRFSIMIRSRLPQISLQNVHLVWKQLLFGLDVVHDIEDAHLIRVLRPSPVVNVLKLFLLLLPTLLLNKLEYLLLENVTDICGKSSSLPKSSTLLCLVSSMLLCYCVILLLQSTNTPAYLVLASMIEKEVK